MKKSYLLALVPIVGIAVKKIIDLKKFDPAKYGSQALADRFNEYVEKQEQNEEKTE